MGNEFAGGPPLGMGGPEPFVQQQMQMAQVGASPSTCVSQIPFLNIISVQAASCCCSCIRCLACLYDWEGLKGSIPGLFGHLDASRLALCFAQLESNGIEQGLICMLASSPDSAQGGVAQPMRSNDLAAAAGTCHGCAGDAYVATHIADVWCVRMKMQQIQMQRQVQAQVQRQMQAQQSALQAQLRAAQQAAQQAQQQAEQFQRAATQVLQPSLQSPSGSPEALFPKCMTSAPRQANRVL